MRSNIYLFLMQLWPWMKVKAIQTGIQMQFGCLYHHIKFEIYLSLNILMQANVNIFGQNHISRVLSLKYWLDAVTWVWDSSDQQVSAEDKIPSTSCKNFVR